MKAREKLTTLITVLTILLGTISAHALYFGPATDLGMVGNAPDLSADGLTLYYYKSDGTVWSSSRSSVESAWGNETQQTTFEAKMPSVSSDQLTLYYNSYGGGYGNYDLYQATRADVNSQFSNPTNLGGTVNSSQLEGDPEISGDGLSLYFSYRNIGAGTPADIVVSQRTDINSAWGTPQAVNGSVNTEYDEKFPGISMDGLILFFMSPRPGGYGAYDIYYSTRAAINDPWGAGANAGIDVNSLNPGAPEFSAIDNGLYFGAAVGNEAHIFFAPVIPEPAMGLIAIAFVAMTGKLRKQRFNK